MPLVRSLPEHATLADLRTRYADLLELFRPYGERLMRGPSPFTPGERELIAAYVSGLNGCRFCFNVHSRVACGFGIDERLFATLVDDQQPAGARMQPILRYVRKLTETPALLTPQDAAAVYDAGWDDTALVHAIAVCAYFNMMNRLVEGAGIVGDAEATPSPRAGWSSTGTSAALESGGTRYYGPDDLARVRFVKAARRLGFALHEVAALLKLQDGTRCGEARSIAERKLGDVRGKLADLGRIEAALAALVAECRRRRGNISCPLIDSLLRPFNRRFTVSV